ncbi:MAG: hypothetical protein R3E65_12375 [Steroidobacteraceae bacterium]
MSKWLAVILLVANAVLFGWLYQRDVTARAREVVAHAPLPASTPGLTLIAELDELPPAKAGSEPGGVRSEDTSEVLDHVDAADRCISVGPFVDTAARDRFRDWIRDYVAQLHSRAESVRERRFFWVYLEPTSEARAQQSLDDLRDRGVTDTMLIRRGDLKNAISLGLFRSQDSVNRRLAEMSEKGFKPVVVPRFETTERHWVEAQLAAEYGDSLDIPESLLEGATVEPVDCAGLGQGGP